ELRGRKLQFLRDQRRILCDAAGVPTRIRVLFVDCCRQHADRADEQLAILFGGFLQPLDVLLDVAGHLVEVFGQLADFRGAAYGRALVKLTTADGTRGRGQATDRRTDADGEEISKKDGGKYDDGNEG